MFDSKIENRVAIYLIGLIALAMCLGCAPAMVRSTVCPHKELIAENSRSAFSCLNQKHGIYCNRDRGHSGNCHSYSVDGDCMNFERTYEMVSK